MCRSGKTILVTDSGLGGMSIFAQLANHLGEKSPWQNVSMIYFNAWPEQDRGYNHFETMNQKAAIFNTFLGFSTNLLIYSSAISSQTFFKLFQIKTGYSFRVVYMIQSFSFT